MATDTLPQLLLANRRAWGDRTAMREKEFGIWQAYTWADYAEGVEVMARGFHSLGLRAGDRMAIIGDNRPELYWSCLAAQAIGVVPVPLYQDSIAAEVGRALQHAEARAIVAENQEQVDKVLAMLGDVPSLEHVFYDDPKGLTGYVEPILRSLRTVIASGHEHRSAEPAWFTEQVERGTADDVALMSYTSGSTGEPKGVLLTQGNLMASAASTLGREQWRLGDEGVAYLPMAWIGDTAFTLAMSLKAGAIVNCPEDPATVQRDIREIGPMLLVGPPRIWENLLTDIRIRIDDADRLKRFLYRRFIAVADDVERARMAGTKPRSATRALHLLGRAVIYGPIRDQIGLRRIRYAYTGGASLGPDTLRFYRGIGVNLKQVYGLTEAGGLVCTQGDDDVKPDSVGRPLDDVDVTVSASGEILIRSRGLFHGYFRNDEATAKALVDGWLQTGDAGFVDDDGHLIVIDRASDLSQLQNGTTFAPQFIENKLKYSPYVKEAVALGADLPYVAALVQADGASVGRWAEKRGIPYTSYADLCLRPEVHELIRGEVEEVNRSLPQGSTISRFLVLHKELDPDDGEITRTRKLRRRLIGERYGDLIIAIYTGASTAKVSTTVTYEDGQTREIEAVLPIGSLGAAVPVP